MGYYLDDEQGQPLVKPAAAPQTVGIADAFHAPQSLDEVRNNPAFQGNMDIARNFINGVMFNTEPQIVGGLRSLIGGQDYATQRDNERALQAAYQAAHPYAAMEGSAAGASGPALALLQKARLLSAAAPTLAGKALNVVKNAAGGGLLGSLYGGGETGTLAGAVQGGETGAKWGGGLGAVGELASLLLETGASGANVLKRKYLEDALGVTKPERRNIASKAPTMLDANGRPTFDPAQEVSTVDPLTRRLDLLEEMGVGKNLPNDAKDAQTYLAGLADPLQTDLTNYASQAAGSNIPVVPSDRRSYGMIADALTAGKTGKAQGFINQATETGNRYAGTNRDFMDALNLKRALDAEAYAGKSAGATSDVSQRAFDQTRANEVRKAMTGWAQDNMPDAGAQWTDTNAKLDALSSFEPGLKDRALQPAITPLTKALFSKALIAGGTAASGIPGVGLIADALMTLGQWKPATASRIMGNIGAGAESAAPVAETPLSAIIGGLTGGNEQKPAAGTTPMKSSTVDRHALLDSLIQQESGGDPNAIGPMTKYGTAKGLGQLLDATGQEWHAKLKLPGEYDPMNAEQNRAISLAYMSHLLDQYPDAAVALGAYNYGPGNMDKAIAKAGVDPESATWADVLPHLPEQTANYAPEILKRLGMEA